MSSMPPKVYSDKALAVMTDRLAEYRGATHKEKKAIVKSVSRKLLSIEDSSMAPLDLIQAEKVPLNLP